MQYIELDTPALLIDRERLTKNLKDMQSYADAHGVALRPHTKTHKCPEIAKMQLAAGACGIAVAKVGEAEAMAEAGLDDLFIANEIVGEAKLRRIAALAKRGVKLAFGVDTPCQVTAAESVFAQEGVSVPVLVEIEVGENRSGVIESASARMCRSAAFSRTTATAILRPIWMRSAPCPKGHSGGRCILRSSPRSMACRARRSATARRRHS